MGSEIALPQEGELLPKALLDPAHPLCLGMENKDPAKAPKAQAGLSCPTSLALGSKEEQDEHQDAQAAGDGSILARISSTPRCQGSAQIKLSFHRLAGVGRGLKDHPIPTFHKKIPCAVSPLFRATFPCDCLYPEPRQPCSSRELGECHL